MWKKSSSTRPPPPALPRAMLAPSLAMTKTLRRASGWVSEAKVPSDAGDEDAAHLVGEAGANLHDAWIVAARAARSAR